MKRLLYKELLKWKHRDTRKPLILNGARQVGKTWLLKEFGRNEYANVAYINCDNNSQMDILFTDYDTSRLIRGFSAISGENIEPGKTLIILDEIQESPYALTSLKYFAENAPEYHIAVAGSLLGIKMHSGTGFPVGKVDTLRLYPLSFAEFLMAIGKDVLLNIIETDSLEDANIALPQLVELLRQYYYTGGMPSVVASYAKNQNLKEVRKIQRSILDDYENDFSKHAPKHEIPKIFAIWNSIPSQLAKENKKFIYGAIRKGARAKDYENAIQWLIKAGLVYKVPRTKQLEKPLKFYEDQDCFKLFFLDLGLLGAIVDVSASDILIGNNAFSTYKGSFTEQYVAQQYFSAIGERLFYYTNENSTLEIDFVSEFRNIHPIEVKAEKNLKSKSLSTILKKNESLAAIRFSMAPYKKQDRITNVPLPLVEKYFTMVQVQESD